MIAKIACAVFLSDTHFLDISDKTVLLLLRIPNNQLLIIAWVRAYS